MATITVTAAVALVRRNLDELDPNGSIMYTDENGSSADYGDNSSLDGIVGKNLAEAVNEIHKAAPVNMLEALAQATGSSSSDGVITVTGLSDFLRLVSFKASDSDITVTDAVAEASPEGRKQANPYVRGTYDRPRLVKVQGEDSFRYYSTKGGGAMGVLCYVRQQTEGAASYEYSSLLRQNIVDWLTAKVLETFGDSRAQNVWGRALTFHER